MLSGDISGCSHYLRASEYQCRSVAKRAKNVVLAMLPRKEV
jgi:hypothetical protein